MNLYGKEVAGKNGLLAFGWRHSTEISVRTPFVFVLCNVSISTRVSDCWLSFETVYIKPLQVYAHNTSSTSVAVSWDEPGDLTHGVFCGVEILYRLNDSSQKFGVRVASRIPGYELIDLMKYSVYAISVKSFTLEGEGKESDEVLVRTAEDSE